jgi:hypothetical protein
VAGDETMESYLIPGTDPNAYFRVAVEIP